MDLLTAEHLTKRYASHTALDDVSLAIPRGSVYGLLGPNGAGKTTLIRIINRITAPDSGRVLFEGRDIAPADIRRIGYLPEERGLYRKMKVGEQALFFARLKGLSRAEATARLKEWFVRLGIEGWWNRRVEELSKGMAQKVQFVITVLHRPELLIFDEPFSGFDPINAEQLKREMLALRDAGATIIFSTHNMASVEELCDHITLIDRSHNILTGPVDAIRRRYGAGLFEATCRGAGVRFGELLEPLCEEVEEAPGDDAPALRTLRLRLREGVEVRAVIAALNEAAELRSFGEIIPSMNDLFIRAVNRTL